MRYVTFVVGRIDDENCPDDAAPPDPAVKGEAIHYVNLLDDGTGVALYELGGDLDQRTARLEADPAVLSVERSGASDGLVYVHFRATALTTDLLGLFRRYEIVVDWPMEYTRQGGLRITIIGEDSTIRAALAAMPDGVEIALDGVGAYHRETHRLSSQLTDRQRELLELAIDAGYYDVPRRTTLRDLADRVGISAATVGEHLRKVESKAVMDLV